MNLKACIIFNADYDWHGYGKGDPGGISSLPLSITRIQSTNLPKQSRKLRTISNNGYPGSQVGLPDMGCCKRLFGIILLSGLHLSNSNCTTRKLCCWKKVIAFFPFFPFVNFVDIFRNSIFLKYYTFKQSL